MLEEVLPFVAALFVLSQVSERISNFLKLHLPRRWFGNLDIKDPNPFREKIRERKILLISLLGGALTTLLLFLAYIVPAFNDSAHTPPTFVSYMNEHKGPSALLTTLFLSFGSKFWHDVLDIIFLYKNAQRLIKSGEAAYADSPEQINEMLNTSSVQIARRVLNDKRKALMAIPGVIAVGIGTSSDEVPVLRLYYTENSPAANMASEIPWEDGNGILRTIRMEKILSGRILAQAASVGGKIANDKNKAGYGTMGFIFADAFKKDQYYASSCYHVLKPAGHPWEAFSKDPANVVCHLKGENDCVETTTLFRGLRSDTLDIALSKLTAISQIDLNSLPPVANAVNMDAYYNNVPVMIHTNKGPVRGYIHEFSIEAVVDYEEGPSATFIDFFSIRADRSRDPDTLRSVTVGGDSGAAVYAGEEALGMVVGGNEHLTLAMKVKSIENNLGVRLFPHPSLAPFQQQSS